MINFFKKLFGFTGNTFNPGAIQDRKDPRDYKWEEFSPAFAPFVWQNGFDVEVELRKRLNNMNFKLPVKDQGNTGSCGGQAWATYGSVLEALSTGSFEERSAKFIYAQTHVNQPGGGSSGRDNNALVQKQGFGLEELTVSYENGLPPTEYFMERAQDISDAARQKASKTKALSYVAVNPDIDSVAHAIASNMGVIIGLSGVNNGTARNAMPVAPTSKELIYSWRHWEYSGKAMILPSGKKAIAVLNSWGPGVGDKGWQWITEDYFKTFSVWACWALVVAVDNTPDPAFKHDFEVNMQLYDQNSEVWALQIALKITGDFPAQVKPSGYYGNVTAAAVASFQLKHGIVPTSRNSAGPKTRAALNVLFK